MVLELAEKISLVTLIRKMNCENLSVSVTCYIRHVVNWNEMDTYSNISVIILSSIPQPTKDTFPKLAMGSSNEVDDPRIVGDSWRQFLTTYHRETLTNLLERHRGAVHYH